MSFGTIGKSVKDLFDDKKHYDLVNNVFTVRAKSGASSWTSTHKISDAIVSDLQFKFKCPLTGAAVEVKGNTAEKFELKAKYDKIAGLTTELKLEDDKGKSSCSLDSAYTYDVATVSLKPEFTNAERNVSAGVVLASQGYSVGAELKSNLAATPLALADYNVAAQYKANDVNVAVATSKKLSGVTLSVLHNYSKAAQIAFQASYAKVEVKESKDAPKAEAKAEAKDAPKAETTELVLTVGGKYDVDASNSLQGKLNNAGNLTVLYKHTLAPWARMGLLGQCNLLTRAKPNFAVQLTVGDDE